MPHACRRVAAVFALANATKRQQQPRGNNCPPGTAIVLSLCSSCLCQINATADVAEHTDPEHRKPEQLHLPLPLAAQLISSLCVGFDFNLRRMYALIVDKLIHNSQKQHGWNYSLCDVLPLLGLLENAVEPGGQAR